MNRNVGFLLRPLVALALFALVTAQTNGALRASGVWGGPGGNRMAGAATADPVAAVDALIAHTEPAAVASTHDPFQLGSPPAPTTHAGPVVHRIVVPPPPPQPVLTAIVWDADPRALVHWKGRDWTVRPGGLFDEFQVTGITRDQVTLTHGGQTMVLQRKAQGD